VYLDGTLKGSTNYNGELLIEDLSPENYTVKATKSGYEDDSEDVYVEAGETKTLYLTLKKGEYYYIFKTKDGKIYILSENYDDPSIKEYYIKKHTEAYESFPYLIKWGITLFKGGLWALLGSILSDGLEMYLKGEKSLDYYEVAKDSVEKPVYDSEKLMMVQDICTPNGYRLPTGKFYSWNDFLPLYYCSECSMTSSYIPDYIKQTLSAQSFGEFCRFDTLINGDYFIPIYVNVDPIFYDDSFVKEAQKKAEVETLKVVFDELINIYLQNSLQISLNCPVDVHLYDSKNNHVGVNYETAQVEINVPNSFYFEDGERKWIVIENPKDTYKIDLIGRGKGTFNLSIKNPKKDEVKNIVYENKPVTLKTKAEIEINPSSDYTMKMDKDGDGVFEEEIKPDKIEIITPREPETKTPPPPPPINNNYLYFGIIIAIIIASIVLIFSRGHFQPPPERPRVKERPLRELTGKPIVREAPKQDIGKETIRMDKKTRELYGVKPGEEVIIRGKSEIRGKVKPALKKDVGKGIVRMDKKLRKEAGLRPGEAVAIIPKKTPVLEVHQAKKEDAKKNIVRIDKKTRERLGVEKGEYVYVVGRTKAKAKVAPAHKGDTGKNIIRMNKKLREKAGVQFKEKVRIEKVEEDEE